MRCPGDAGKRCAFGHDDEGEDWRRVLHEFESTVHHPRWKSLLMLATHLLAANPSPCNNPLAFDKPISFIASIDLLLHINQYKYASTITIVPSSLICITSCHLITLTAIPILHCHHSSNPIKLTATIEGSCRASSAVIVVVKDLM